MPVRSFGPGVEHGLHVGNRVTEVSDHTPAAIRQKAVAELHKTAGVRLVRGIAHGDQRRIHQSQSLLKHESRRWRFRTTHEPPTPAVPNQRSKEISAHQQGFITDVSRPIPWITIGIGPEIKITEHINQLISDRQRVAMSAQQFQAGVPVVVPAAFAFESVDAGGSRLPAAVVLHGCLEGSAITSRHITDHSVDVEQQKLAGGWLPFQDGWI